MTLLINRGGLTYPSLLYKYKVDIAHLEDIFLTSELFFPKPELLNDPFDIRYMYDDDSYYSMMKSSKRWKKFEKFIEDEKEPNKEIFYKFSNSINRRGIAVFSMSKSSECRLLWGYYAGGYTGYCIEFDFCEGASFKDRIFEVEYSLESDMIPKDKYRDLTKVENYYKPFVVKHKDWIHEKEYRAIVESKKWDSFSERRIIEKRLIKSIIFGYKADDVLIHNLREMADQNGFQHVEFYKLHLINSGLIKKIVEF